MTDSANTVPSFVGRESNLAHLEERFEQMLAGQGCTVLIAGDAGIGKTALITRFLRDVVDPWNAGTPQDRNGKVVRYATAAAIEIASGGDPFAPFVQLFGALARQPKAVQLRRVMPVLGRLVPKLLQIVPSAGPILSETAAMLFEFEKTRMLAPGDRPGHESFKNRYIEFLVERAQKTPLVLFLDDLHWADDSSISLLYALAHCIQQHPILLIGAYRPFAIETPAGAPLHPLKHALNEMRRRQAVVQLELGYLTEEDVRQYLKSAFPGLESDRGFIEWFCLHTGGWPLFMVEIMQWLTNQGYVRQQGEVFVSTTFDRTKIPDSLDAVVDMTYQVMSDELRKTVSYASAQGDPFRAVILADLLGISERDTYDRLKTLHSVYRMVDESPHPESSLRQADWRFSHSLKQKAIYNRLPQTERVCLHRDVVESYERLWATDIGAVAIDLAVHCEASELYGKAAQYRAMAASRAAYADAPRTCLEHTNQGLADLAAAAASEQEKATLLELLYLDARARNETSEDLDRALEQAVRWARLSLEAGEVRKLIFRYNVLPVLLKQMGVAYRDLSALPIPYERIWQMARASGDAILMARCWDIGALRMGVASMAQITDYLHETLAVARSQQDTVAEVLAGRSLGEVCQMLGKDEEAAEAYTVVLDLIRRGDEGRWQEYRLLSPWFPDRHEVLGQCLERLGDLAKKRGDYQQAISHYQSVVEMARTNHNLLQEAGLLNLVALTQRDAGDLTAAQTTINQALRVVRSTEVTSLLAKIIANALAIAARLRDIPELERLLAELQDLAKVCDLLWVEPVLAERRGDLHRIKGDYETAVSYYYQVVELGRAQKDPNREAGLLNVIACALREKGDLLHASKVIQEALPVARASDNQHTQMHVLKTAIANARDLNRPEEVSQLEEEYKNLL